MKYIGILPDKKYVIKDSLEELNNVRHIEYILKEDLPNEWPARGWPKYSFINPDGSSRTLKIGNYEVIDIDFQDKRFKSGRVVTIIEVDSMQSKQFSFTNPLHEFFTKELLPLLDELNEFGNLKRYLKNKYNEGEIKRLEERLVATNKIIEELSTKLKAYEGKKGNLI